MYTVAGLATPMNRKPIEVIRLCPLTLLTRTRSRWVAILSDKRTEWQRSGSLKLGMSSRKFSEYYEKMERIVQERKRVKLDVVTVGLDDPYTFDCGQGEIVAMPEVEYPDIYNFLINTPLVLTQRKS